MAERVTIEIRAIDRASTSIRRVTSALGNMATIVGGLIAYRLFSKLASAMSRAAKAAMIAYEWYDRIRYSLTELARAEILDSMDRLAMSTADYANVLTLAKESAQELLDWTIKLAIQSPFSAEDVNKMFRLVRAYGFGTIEAKSLTLQIMNFAAATGFGAQVLERMGLALGQVQQRGRLAGEEIRQLINVGIPVRDIVAKALNVTTGELEKMIRAGKIAADVALPAILEWMQRFDGASQRAVKTWQGLVANMKDVKDLNMIAFFKGVAEAMHPALQGVFDIMSSDEFMATLERLGKQVGDFIGPIVEKLPRAVQTLGTLLAIFQAFSAGHITFGTMVAGFLEMIGKIDGSTASIQNVKNLVDGLALTFQTWKQKLSDFVEVWLGPLRDDLPAWLTSISEISFTSFESFAPMFERFGQSITAISESAAPEIIQNLTDSLANLSTWWASGASDNAAKIIEFLLTLAAGGVAGGILLLATAIGALTDVLVGEDPMPRLDSMMEVFREIADTVATTPLMQEAATTAAMLTVPLPQEEGDAAGSDLAWKLIDGITAPLDENMQVAEATIAMLERAGISATAWSTMTGEQQLALVGKNMAAGFGDGFSAEADVQIGVMKAKLQTIIDIVNQMYLIESPSKVFKKAGINLMKGLGVGIVKGTKGMMNDVVSSAQLVGSTLTGGMQPAAATVGPSVDQSRNSNIIIQNMPINTGQDEDAMLNTLKRV